jgi:hypothetical protein
MVCCQFLCRSLLVKFGQQIRVVYRCCFGTHEFEVKGQMFVLMFSYSTDESSLHLSVAVLAKDLYRLVMNSTCSGGFSGDVRPLPPHLWRNGDGNTGRDGRRRHAF